MQQMIQDALVAWVDAAGLALLAIIAGLLVYKALVYLIGRFAESASVGRIFFDAAARAIGVSLALIA